MKQNLSCVSLTGLPCIFSGSVLDCRIGDAVFGQAAGCLGSAVLCNGHALVPKPPAVTFTEAATIPTVFLTAYSCLHEEAAISTKSRVLVHAATGVSLPDNLLVLIRQCAYTQLLHQA